VAAAPPVAGRHLSTNAASIEMTTPPRIERFTVAPGDAGERLDRYLAARLPDLSRSRIQELIAEGHVRVAGRTARASHRVVAGELIEAEVIPRPPLRAAPEAIPLDILYEDDDLVAVNKPAGMVTHAGAGHAAGTLVNALLGRYARLSGVGGALRPGIVHRLDRGTSGVVLVARTDASHRALAEQFRARAVDKRYLALVHGALRGERGRIELPVSRDAVRRTRMTARRRSGRDARTDWRVLARLPGFTLVEAALHTGRTHQIRVHFAALGRPVVGDVLYGAPRQVRAGRITLPPLGRNFLHAARISFLQPRTGAPVEVCAPLPGELREWLAQLVRELEVDPTSIDAALRGFL
jgi:23S rRNA pseudouridine1911/1915/1917 synthase